MIQYLIIIGAFMLASVAGYGLWESANVELNKMGRGPMARAHRSRLLGRS